LFRGRWLWALPYGVIMPIGDRSEEIRRKPSYRAAVWLQRLACVWALGWVCAWAPLVAVPHQVWTAHPHDRVVFLTWLPGALLGVSTFVLVRLAGVRFEVFTRRRLTWPLEREMGRLDPDAPDAPRPPVCAVID
jgi:hypothetical protein